MGKRASLAFLAFLTAIACFGISSPAAMPSRYGHVHTCDKSRRDGYYIAHPESCRLYLICDNSGNLFDGDCGENGTFDKSSLTCVSKAKIPCTRQEETDTDKVATTISIAPSTESTTLTSDSLVDTESSSSVATSSSPAPLSLASSDVVTTAMESDAVEETSEPNTKNRNRPNQTESLATSGVQKLINQSTTNAESTEKITTTTSLITPQTTSNIAMSSSPVPLTAAATSATLVSTDTTEEATATPAVLTHTHTHSTLPPPDRFQFFTTTTSGDIQKTARTTTRSATLDSLKDATITESSDIMQTEAIETAKLMVPSSVQPSTTEATTIVPRLETSTTQKVTTVSESLTSVESLKDTLSSLGSDYDMFFEDEDEETHFADYAALLGADYYSNSLYDDYSLASQDYGDFFTDEDEPQDKQRVDHCQYHSDGNYIPQSMIAEGCIEYVRCQDGETQVKQCPVGMTYDWKKTECVDPESNSVENCRPESLQQASQEHENLVDPSLSKECLHRKDGLYISQDMILEGCKNYISCKDENGRMETCSGEKTFDWKLKACVDPKKNTVPDCALVST